MFILYYLGFLAMLPLSITKSNRESIYRYLSVTFFERPGGKLKFWFMNLFSLGVVALVLAFGSGIFDNTENNIQKGSAIKEVFVEEASKEKALALLEAQKEADAKALAESKAKMEEELKAKIEADLAASKARAREDQERVIKESQNKITLFNIDKGTGTSYLFAYKTIADCNRDKIRIIQHNKKVDCNAIKDKQEFQVRDGMKISGLAFSFDIDNLDRPIKYYPVFKSSTGKYVTSVNFVLPYSGIMLNNVSESTISLLAGEFSMSGDSYSKSEVEKIKEFATQLSDSNSDTERKEAGADSLSKIETEAGEQFLFAYRTIDGCMLDKRRIQQHKHGVKCDTPIGTKTIWVNNKDYKLSGIAFSFDINLERKFDKSEITYYPVFVDAQGKYAVASGLSVDYSGIQLKYVSSSTIEKAMSGKIVE